MKVKDFDRNDLYELTPAQAKLLEAQNLQTSAVDASQWLATATKAGVEALSQAGGDGSLGGAFNSLHAAIQSLSTAILGAIDAGVDAETIASAEALLATLTSSSRRATIRRNSLSAQGHKLKALALFGASSYSQLQEDAASMEA